MPSYLADPNQAAMPVLRMQPTPPVQVTMPIARAQSNAGKSGSLDTQALGKKIAAYLQQKYGASGGIDDLGTLGDEPLINEILAGGGNGSLGNIDSLGMLGDESLINSMGIGGI